MNGLYALKPWYTRRLRVVMDRAAARGTSPDVFTVIGIAGAGAAAITIAVGWWPLSVLLLAVRLAGANLDGAVARARGVSRPWGFVFNEIGDRVSDLLMFAGLAVWAAYLGGPGLHWLSWPVISRVGGRTCRHAADVRLFGGCRGGCAPAQRRTVR